MAPKRTTISRKRTPKAPAKPAIATVARKRDIFQPEVGTPPHLHATVVRLLGQIENHRYHFERSATREDDGSDSYASPSRQREMHARQALRLAGQLTSLVADWAIQHITDTADSPRLAMAALLAGSGWPADHAKPFADALRAVEHGEAPPLLTPAREPGKRQPKTTLAMREMQTAALAYVAFQTAKGWQHDAAVSEVLTAFGVAEQRTVERWQTELRQSRPVAFTREMEAAREAGRHCRELKLTPGNDTLKKYAADYGTGNMKVLGKRYRALQRQLPKTTAKAR